MTLSQAKLQAVIMRANQAPSVHNTQPARWRPAVDHIKIACDPTVALSVGDPDGIDAGLSCGAAVEATVLALSAHGIGALVEECWAEEDYVSIPGLRLAAVIHLEPQGALDGLHSMLEERFTWRDEFAVGTPNLFGWSREDTEFILDGPQRDWIASLNDQVSLEIMRSRPFRRELLSWMRLGGHHPRYALDGLSREALRMSVFEARAARFALGSLFGLLDRFGIAKGLVQEAEKTKGAPLIAAFHRPKNESPVTSGRAYLRLCLEAAQLGLSGWPMAALSDHDRSRKEIMVRLGLLADRRLVQVLRFGAAPEPMPQRARRPIEELLI